MTTKVSSVKTPAARPAATPSKPRQSTLVPRSGARKSSTNGFASHSKAKPKPNGSILSFFKKSEESNSGGLFLEERGSRRSTRDAEATVELVGWEDDFQCGDMAEEENSEQGRFNESGGSVKRRKISKDAVGRACTPPPTDISEDGAQKMESTAGKTIKVPRRVGPFVDVSDTEDEEPTPTENQKSHFKLEKPPKDGSTSSNDEDSIAPRDEITDSENPQSDLKPPLVKIEMTNASLSNDFDGFQDLEDEDLPEGEECDERRWMEEQRRLEMAEGGFEGDTDDFNDVSVSKLEDRVEDAVSFKESEAPSCPICSASLAGVSDQGASVHVNACLDGNPVPLPERTASDREVSVKVENSKRFQRPIRPPKPGQQDPFMLGNANTEPKSAFSKLMASHAEDAAWATAAAAESAGRGKPSYQRTCPFYKILPGFFICIDAFRYGAVKGCQAYFLSHFHSDHYIGLTASWCHGPIYCSRVTANLVRQQLRVDPKWVLDLEFEKNTEVPGTEGVHVTMIPANHCPGSSLFLFEKVIKKGQNPKSQRILHCGDFRACRAHVEHPLLRPDVLDAVGGKIGQQKLDVCYLDTTYLNPRYAFPAQEEVIQACADMCVSLNKPQADDNDGWAQMKRERAGEGMVKFVRRESEVKQEEDRHDDVDSMKAKIEFNTTKVRGRLLVVVGTYSIGKERMCLGIARALKSKIYAPAGKQRICACLEDPELDALLTNDPREAQVHMTPLFEIRAETLDDYLNGYRDHFSRAVGFRPSGWNYRPPNSRFVENPSVQTVLHSQNWKSTYTMRELVPQRGSTSRCSCFGVPYSEHSSFRELTMFCCALRIDKIIPTVNVGSAKNREKMKAWCEKWTAEKKKNGLFRLEDGETS